jgi:hypothetical protein
MLSPGRFPASTGLDRAAWRRQRWSFRRLFLSAVFWVIGGIRLASK